MSKNGSTKDVTKAKKQKKGKKRENNFVEES